MGPFIFMATYQAATQQRLFSGHYRMTVSQAMCLNTVKCENENVPLLPYSGRYFLPALKLSLKITFVVVT